MGSSALQSTEVEVEQTSVCKLVDTELPGKVYGSPIVTAAMEDHVAGLQAECRPGSTCAEHPQKYLEQLSCPSSLPRWYRWHLPAGWRHSRAS
jgi:hypothetical protein